MPIPTADQMLESATERHRAGDLAEAKRRYRQLLAEFPTHVIALFRLGLLELQAGHPGEALALIERVVAAAPDEPRHQFGLGQVLQALGRWDDATAAYRRVLQADPRSADAHFALGVTLQSQENYRGAIDAYEAAVNLQADLSGAFNNLGICRQRCGDLSQAAAAYSQAIALQPDSALARSNLGTVLQDLGRMDEAVDMLRSAVALEPLVSSHAVNLGIALCRRGDHAAAEGILSGTLQRDAGNAEVLFNLGNALHGMGRAPEAMERYRQALVLRPDYADALNNLGNIHKELGEFTSAAACYEAAIHVRPDFVVALNNAGCLLRTLGRIDEAEHLLRRAVQLNPSHAALYDNLGSVLKDAGELDAAINCFRKSLELDPDGAATHSNLAYALCFQSPEGPPILEECLRWNQRFAAKWLPTEHRRAGDRSADRRLRIGYVSADFRDHCQSLFTIPLLAHHDHAAYEIFCYAGVVRADDYTRRIMGLADVWRDVRLLDDGALCELIGEDRIDILVDLTMHMAGGRPLVFARKPAPIQIAWLAYPGTTGIGAMDYRFTDPRLDPTDVAGHYSERSVRLPDSFWCYDPLADEPKINSLPALERGHLTLGCLNNPCKLTEPTLALCGGVMRGLPGSRLLLMAPPGRHRSRLLQRLAAQGIAAERVDFTPFRARAEYLRSYHDIDLGLDTFPYNGHTTSLDSLWMGVPVVTRVGRTCVGRGGLSQLYHLDLLELAAETDSAFIAAAVALGSDLPRLAALRGQLRGRLESSPLMDAGRFAKHIEAAYREVWTDYCGLAHSP